MSNKNNNISDTRDREIRLTREFDAPRELVFKAFTNPKHIGQWWGPDGFSTTTESMSFKVGGEWIFTMHGPDGTDYPNHIVYTDIKKPKYLKYDHYGHKDQEGDPPHFKSTITFENLGEKTKIEMQMFFPTAEKRNEAAEFGAIEGGKQTLNRLAEYLKEQSAS
ncbi:SRPBCC family protein [Fodinibius salsisoli]|uniref:SRPBCC family protein n=1 Tax=Fodinibius salsisoli TaxID=2820877 RepID=A0ABT3PHY5_9BACT|nr:SRPBCC family protein [Fodinibius salsisoli]MCW9705541.1 SRPBCC family protein [Fodinibius salsisoli]